MIINKIKILAIVPVLFALIAGCNNNIIKGKDDPKDSINTENMKYKIIITNYYFGRKQHITTVTGDSLYSLHDLMTGKKTSENRALTKSETEKLVTFLNKFPLTELKENYVSNTVEDGTIIDFSITINKLHKNIHVANIYQKDLGALVDVIVRFLKDDYIDYNLSSVPWKE